MEQIPVKKLTEALRDLGFPRLADAAVTFGGKLPRPIVATVREHLTEKGSAEHVSVRRSLLFLEQERMKEMGLI